MSLKPLVTVPVKVVEQAVFGALEVERTDRGLVPRRLPSWTRAQYPSSVVDWVASQTTGVHLDFLTAADTITLDVMITRNMSDDVDSSTRLSTFIAVVDGVETNRVALNEGHQIRVNDDAGYAELEGCPSRVSFDLPPTADGAERRVVIWLPHNSWVEILRVQSSAALRAAPARGVLTWLHHGSSISHCTNADGPLETWPAIASAHLDVDVVNLGFNGQALLDPFTAASIRDAAADVITLKVGINIVNGDVMRARAFTPALHGFLDIIRQGHPTTPIVFISPIACPIHEDVPGPTVPIEGADTERFTGTPRRLKDDGVLTLGRVRALAEQVIRYRMESDPRLFYLDGQILLGEPDSYLLYDNLHPNGEGYRLMGERFAALVNSTDSPLAHAFGVARASARAKDYGEVIGLHHFIN